MTELASRNMINMTLPTGCYILVADPAAPFGGVKQSGIGREGAHEGLLDYVEPKYVAVNW